MIAAIHAELDALLSGDEFNSKQLAGLLQTLTRLARYQRRFRGRRDRALRRTLVRGRRSGEDTCMML
jgi:hypothetical protein